MTNTAVLGVVSDTTLVKYFWNQYFLLGTYLVFIISSSRRWGSFCGVHHRRERSCASWRQRCPALRHFKPHNLRLNITNFNNFYLRNCIIDLRGLWQRFFLVTVTRIQFILYCINILAFYIRFFIRIATRVFSNSFTTPLFVAKFIYAHVYVFRTCLSIAKILAHRFTIYEYMIVL